MPVQPLVLLEDIKEQLVVLSGNTDFDDRLNRFILVASVSISEHIDRVLDYTAQVDVHRTTNTARFSYDFSSTTNESGISGAG